jgi:hypothetical protein
VKSYYKGKRLCTKSLRLRCYGKNGRLQEQRTSKHIVRVTVDGRWKRGRKRKRRREEIEDDLNTVGIKNQIRDLGDGGRLYWNQRDRAEDEESRMRRERKSEIYFELRSYDM